MKAVDTDLEKEKKSVAQTWQALVKFVGEDGRGDG